MIRHILVFCCLFGICLCQAQIRINSLSVAATSESIAIPLTRIAPIHPGLEIGANLWYKDKPKTVQQFNAYLGFYHHEVLQNSFYLRAEYLHRFLLWQKLGLDLSGSLGYMHSFTAAEVYEQSSETGLFSKANQTGVGHGIVELGLGFAYVNSSRFEPFIRTSLLIQALLIDEFPVLPHSLIKIGVNIKL